MKKEGVKKAAVGFIIEFGVEGISVLGAEAYSIFRTLISGTMMYGDCLVVLHSIGQLSWSISNFGDMATSIYNVALNIQDYRIFIDTVPSIDPNPYGKMPTIGDIELKGVSFRYRGADCNSLSNLNMKIHNGEKVAIVGGNGAGKTILIKLLMRLYDVTDGSITFGGTDIRDFNLKSYRKCFASVFQDYKQLSLSVAENVLGRPYCNEDYELVVDCLKKAGIYNKIAEQSNGVDSRLTREFDYDGLLLSGGESQKLAIAAVYARKSNVVILDEPTSALDPIAEHEMYENMSLACKGKTIIFISHRLSSAVDADKIFMIENGSVIEEGTHQELINLNGRYAEMFNMQAQNYIINEGDE